MVMEAQTLAMGVGSACIVMLLTTCAWLLKDRMRKAEKKEDLLEKRLSSGSETMHRLLMSLERLQASQVDARARLLSTEAFGAWEKEHVVEHQEMSKDMAKLNEGQTDLRVEIAGLGERIEGKLSAMSSLMAKKIEVRDAD